MDHLSGFATEVLLSVKKSATMYFYLYVLQKTRTVLPCRVTLESTIWQTVVRSWHSSHGSMLTVGSIHKGIFP